MWYVDLEARRALYFVSVYCIVSIGSTKSAKCKLVYLLIRELNFNLMSRQPQAVAYASLNALFSEQKDWSIIRREDRNRKSRAKTSCACDQQVINYVIWYFSKLKPENARLWLHLLDSRKPAWFQSAGNVQLCVFLGRMEVRSCVFRGLRSQKSTSWHSVNQISKITLTSALIASPFVRMNCFAMVLKCICSSAWIVGVGGLKILVILALTPFVLLKVSRCSSRVSILCQDFMYCSRHSCVSWINFTVNRFYSEGCVAIHISFFRVDPEMLNGGWTFTVEEFSFFRALFELKTKIEIVIKIESFIEKVIINIILKI